MKKLIFLAVFSMGMLTAAAQTGPIYVSPNGSPNNEGTADWDDAFNNLQDAINLASTTGQDIWVAATGPNNAYKPTQQIPGGNSDRDKAFFVYKKNIKIYGGFPASGNPLWADRDPKANPTILSGDIGTVGDNTDNCYHVFVALETSGGILDGFTITGGNADGGSLGYTINNDTTYIIPQSNGGGILLFSSSMQLTDLVVINNVASNSGGGICSERASFHNTGYTIYGNGRIQCPILNRIKITSNIADEGGGIFSSCENENNSYMEIYNTLIYGNTALSRGGAIKTQNKIRIHNMTIADNNSDLGSAIDAYTNSPTVQIFNSIVQGTSRIPAGLSSLHNSIVEGATTSTNNNLPGNTDPLFLDAASGDYGLQYNSPCVNVIHGGGSPDLAGNPRPFGGKSDMGAYEYTIKPNNGVVYVKKNVSGGKQDGSSWANAVPELAPVLHSPPSSANEVWVAASAYAPMYPADGLSTNPKDKAFVINNNLAIYGGFPFNANDNQHTSLLSRDWTSNHTVLNGDVFHILIITKDIMDLDGFIIEGGNADSIGHIMVNGEGISRNNGGGIYHISRNLSRLRNLIIKHNYASNCGGGIYNQFSSLEAIDVTIMNNEASIGGGLYNEGHIDAEANLPSLTMEDSRICGNKAASGSGIYNIDFNIDLYNVLIAQNEVLCNDNGTLLGGSIFNKGTNGTLNHVTISMCKPNGIGIYSTSNSNLDIGNSIVWTDKTSMSNGANGVSVHEDTTCTMNYNHCLIQGIPHAGNNLHPHSNPNFVNLDSDSDYEAFPGDYHLKDGSPCIDFGDPFYTLSNNDLDGNPRIINQTPDLGVYENPNNGTIVENKPFHKSIENNSIFQQENILLSDLKLSVYPNPSSTGQQTKLFLGENNFYYKKPVQIKLYSLDGKLLHNRKYSNGNITLNGPRLSAGMYIINAQTQDGKKYTTKLVVTQ